MIIVMMIYFLTKEGELSSHFVFGVVAAIAVVAGSLLAHEIMTMILS